METMIDEWEKMMLATLDERGRRADKLAGDMIRLSARHATKVCTVMHDLFKAFSVTCRYKADMAWALIGRMTSAFFEHLRGIRVSAQGIDDVGEHPARAHLIWTMMQSLVHSEEILTQRFQSHPIIMKEVMEFQLEHRVDASQLKVVSDEVVAIKGLVKEMATTIAKLERNNAGRARHGHCEI